MTTTKKSVREPKSAAAAQKTEFAETFTTLYSNGIERFAEVQKKSIDIAVKQNAEMRDASRKFAQVVPGAPGLFLLDLAASAFERYADTQKGAVDLVLEQSHALGDILKQRSASVSKAAEGAATIVEQTVEHSVAAQKKVLDYSAAQTKAAFATAKHQFGLAGTPAEAAAELFQRGVVSLIETQKELLDIAAKPLGSVN